MDDQTLAFESAEHQLSGTLVRPDGATALALLISGSGPIDRDSNTKRLRIGAMSAVADRLATARVASFRYDKRGVGDSTGDYRATGLDHNITDARAALDAARSGFDRVFVVGHSEGALIAGQLAADDPSLAGAVLLAGSTQNGDQILRWQMLGVSESIPTPIKWIMKVLRQDLVRTQTKRIEKMRASTADVMRIQGIRVNAKWFREFMAYEPADALRRITSPVLAITGDKDVQVDPDDLERMAELIPGDVTTHRPENLTHLLRTEDGPASVRTYRKQMKRPVDGELLDRVADWVQERATIGNRTPHATL